MRSPKRHIVLCTIALTCLGFLVSVAQAETVYVQAKTAHLRSGKTSLSKIVATVRFGEPLTLLSTEGSWNKVRTARGNTGWIYANKITSTKPSRSESRLAALGKDFRRTEASPATASAGIRGLDEFSGDYARRVGMPPRHRTAVERMTNYRVTDQAVEAFLKAGRLGEYTE